MLRTLPALTLALTVACNPTTEAPSPGGGAAEMVTDTDGLVDAAKTDKVEVPVEKEHGDDTAFTALEGAKVMFTTPADGAEVTSPVKVAFGLEGAEVKPAGTLVEGTGHHHVIVNGDPAEAGKAVPADDTHIHYGKGQTEAELDLPAGEHTLTLQFADGMHRSYGPEVSQTITVKVTE